MNRTLISIIIPVYNVEKFLRSSLESLVVQDIRDCEILLINDGSNDNSISILREYEQRFNNIRVIDKKNEGVSSTRNRGLDECKGEYFYFMDSDDILHPELLSVVKKEIEKSNPDIVVWDFTTFYTKPSFIDIPQVINVEEVDNSKLEAFNYLMANGSAVSLCSKVIRRSLIGDKIRLDSTMSYGEDLFFCWKMVLLAKNIRYIRLPLYYYLQSGNSATCRFHPNLYEHYRKAFDDIREFIKVHGLVSNNVLASLDYHFVSRLPSLTSMELRSPYNRKKQIDHLSYVLEDEYIQRGLKTYPLLSGKIYRLARRKNIAGMLDYARWSNFKQKILFPIKKLFK